MKPSSHKNRNDSNTNYGNNSNFYSNSYASSQTNSVKIPTSAWKISGYTKLHCNDGNVC